MADTVLSPLLENNFRLRGHCLGEPKKLMLEIMLLVTVGANTLKACHPLFSWSVHFDTWQEVLFLKAH